MVEEMRNECIEVSITACEKFASNYEVYISFVQLFFFLLLLFLFLDGGTFN